MLNDEVEDLWADFRRSLARKGRSDSTVDVYRKSYEAFWTWAAGEGIDTAAKVDTAVINRWTDHLLTAPAIRNGKPIMVANPDTGEMVPKLLERSTRRIRYVNLRPFWSWHSHEFDVPNPCDRADVPTLGHEEPVPVVDLADARKLLAVCEGRDFPHARDTAIVRVLYDTGARLGELLALDLADWDNRNDLLTLRGKTGVRVVAASPSTGEALSRYLRQRKTHPKAHLPSFWLGPKGRLTSSGVAQLLKRRCEEAGIAPIHPHRFRHNWAHLMKSAGCSDGDLMFLAGWSSTAMVQRYGRSAAAERAQAAARRFNIGDEL